jgi:hypothetical protein
MTQFSFHLFNVNPSYPFLSAYYDHTVVSVFSCKRLCWLLRGLKNVGIWHSSATSMLLCHGVEGQVAGSGGCSSLGTFMEHLHGQTD